MRNLREISAGVAFQQLTFPMRNNTEGLTKRAFYASRGLALRRAAGYSHRIATTASSRGFNETKTVSVIFNGEIFDHATWRHDLKARGHHLTTSCDTEVLPHLWEEHEEDLFAKLNGQFAVALFDERKQKFVLARDRFGICPLFWTRTTRFGGDWLVFGSEIKTILATGLIEPKPDRRGIDAVFNFLAVPGPFSCFEGINILPPGKMLTIARGRVGEDATISERAYWTMDFPDQGQETRGQDERAVVDEFERLLYGAVKRRLHANAPVASYLSGGVDSSTASPWPAMF